MLRGLYASVSGMIADQRRLEVVANNLANASTIGFKRDTTITQSFGEILLERAGDSTLDPANGERARVGRMTQGAFIAHTATRLTTGSLQSTENPLDVALVGDGFFSINTPQGIRYSRRGNFMQDEDGTLITPAGFEVLVNGYPAVARSGPLSINDKGEVFSGDKILGKLSIATSSQLGTLRKEGNGFWTPVAAEEGAMLFVPEAAAGQFKLRSGYLEGSNVEPVQEMVEMMSIMRSYEANQRLIQVQDETLQKGVTEVGRV